jgi:hypothetical protein
MSETAPTQAPINPDLADQLDNPVQPVTPGQETPYNSGQAESEVPASSEAFTETMDDTATQTSTEASRATEQTRLNPNRGIIGLANRFSNFANRFADRRTTTQVASESFTKTKEAAKVGAKRAAVNVGIAAVVGTNSVIETTEQISKFASEKKVAANDFVAEKRANAQNRKEARIDKRAERSMLNEAHADNRKFDKQAERDEKAMLKEARADNKQFDKQAKIDEKVMLKDAYNENKQYDKKIEDYTKLFKQAERRDKRAENKAGRAETRAELAEKAKKSARFAGKAALFASVGAAYGTYKGVQKSAELGGKIDRKAIEVVSAAGEASVVKVRRGQQVAKERLNEAQIRRANKLFDKSEKVWGKINAREAKNNK